jgi:AAA15 family ATPase/GTPase
MNNFRNFYNTFFELKDVNFLVGENSTGKTSLLALTNLLLDGDFWRYNFHFNTEEYQFGNFDEIADKGKNNGKFDIGILYKESTDSVKCIKISFKDKNGTPNVCKFRFIEKGYDIEVDINSEEIKARYQPIEFPNNNQIEWFKKWIFDIRRRPYNMRSKLDNTDSFVPFPLLKAALITTIQKKEEASNEVDFAEAVKVAEKNICWLAPIRAKARRIYEVDSKYTPEGDHAPFMLKDILLSDMPEKEYLINFGKKSRLFDDLKIKSFGGKENSPFEISVVLNDKVAKVANVGCGVNQVFPLLAEILSRKAKCFYILQQPEVHLHPRAQAEFGELVYDIYKKEQKQFMIETHSDFIIDRFRLCKHRDKEVISKAHILFFERSEDGNKVTSVKIEDNGGYSENQPPQFREFFVNEGLDLLEV